MKTRDKADQVISHDTLMGMKDACKQVLESRKKGARTVVVDAEDLLAALNELTMRRWRAEVEREYAVLREARAATLAKLDEPIG